MKVEYTIKPEDVTTLFKLVKHMKRAIDKHITGALKYDLYFTINNALDHDELELCKQILDLKEIKNTKIKIEA